MAWYRKIRGRQPRLRLRKPGGRGTLRRFPTAALLAGLVLAAPAAARAGGTDRASRRRPADPQGALLPVPRRGGEAEGRARPAAGPDDGRRGRSRARRSCPAERDESLLWERVEADEMPPGDKKLSAREKAVARRLDRPRAPPRRDRSPRPLPTPGPVLTDEEKSFWSFQPIARPEVPRVADRRARSATRSTPSSSPGWRPTAWASRPRPTSRTLIRRAHLRPDRPARRRPRRSTPSSPTPPPMPTSGWSTACWRAPITASAGRGTGSTSPATPTATATPRQDDRPAVRLQVPRLPHPRAQRRPPLGRPDPRATGRRRDGQPALPEPVARAIATA